MNKENEMTRQVKSATTKTKIVILGGGFAGMYAAMELERRLKSDSSVELTLINKDNFFLFTPMLHEVAASDIDPLNIVNPAHKLLRRTRLIVGAATAIDVAKKQVAVSQTINNQTVALGYDHLILALGSTTNFYDLPGVQERALTMKTMTDALRLRGRLVACLEQADAEIDLNLKRQWLTFVVVGGGFAGVETVGGVNDFVREAIRFYPTLQDKMLRVVLVEAGKTLLPEFGGDLSDYTARKLAERGVEIKLETAVESADNAVIKFKNKTEIIAQTLVWAGGVAPNRLIADLPFKKEKGRVATNGFLEVLEAENVWAAGDCAAIPDANNAGKFYAPLAQHAQRQGVCLANNVVAAINNDNRKKRAFTYKTMGQMAAIGRRSGVANVLGWKFSGFFAWVLWRAYYLYALPRFEKRLRVGLDWTLDLIFSKDLVQFNPPPTFLTAQLGETVTTEKPLDSQPTAQTALNAVAAPVEFGATG